jgi:adenylosuccinate lyase
VVQENAMRVWEEGGSLHERLANDPTVTEQISPDALAELFDPQYYLRHLDAIYERSLAHAWEDA